MGIQYDTLVSALLFASEILGDDQEFAAIVAGYDEDMDLPDIRAAAGDFQNTLENLANALEERRVTAGTQSASDNVLFFMQVAVVFAHLFNLIGRSESATSVEGRRRLRAALWDLPTLRVLVRETKLLAATLHAMGVADIRLNDAGQVEHDSRIHLERLTFLLRGDLAYLRSHYTNTGGQMDLDRILDACARLLASMGSSSVIRDANLHAVSDFVERAQQVGDQLLGSRSVIEAALIKIPMGPELWLSLYPFIDTTTDAFALGISFQMQGALTIQIGEVFELEAQPHGPSLPSYKLLLLPQHGLLGVGDADSLSSFGVKVSFRAGSISSPITFYEDDTLRIGVSSLGTNVAFVKDEQDTDEVSGEFSVVGFEFYGKSGQRDGFLQKITQGGELGASVDVVVGYSSLRGWYFEGSGGLEIVIPIHLSLGPINIETIRIVLEVGPKLRLSLSSSFGAQLGPLSVAVKDIGLGIDAELGQTETDWPLDLKTPYFKPPTGTGLSLNAGGIVGGGYLEIDSDKERYAGILALNFGEIGLTAIGLITTKLPGGKKGFSLLVNIGVIFNPPIQLPYGFTLSGVGGLVGLNRTMDVDALRRGIKTRTLDSILFPDPTTVIANANKIISDMRAVFPPADGQFVVGPMVKFGWGYPNLITADVGILIELPDPIRIVLMGQVEATLPEENAALVVIHLDVLGILDFEKEELTFQAALYDSRVLSFAIYGESAFLLAWGNDPRFALSLGGFHPKFTPPPPPVLFAELKRLTISISSGPDLQLACRAYQALTPQSLQFGARVDLYARGGGAVVTGYMGFDTLIYFSPFSFEAWIGAAVKVRYKGATLADVDLSLTLTGPTPWNARGKAKIHVLFYDVKVRFQITWGRREPAVIAPQDPWVPLQDALAAPRNWGGVLPRGRKMVEALRGAEASGPESILVHPTGQLEVRQNVVPLGVTVTKFGNAPVTGHDRFEVRELWANDIKLEAEPVYEFFSRGQSEDLNAQQRLSLPAFEKMEGGVASVGGNVRTVGSAEQKDLGFESIIIKSDRTSELQEDEGVFEWEAAKVMVAVGDRQRAMKRAGPRGRFTSLRPSPKVSASEERYCIAKADDLSRAMTLTGSEGTTNMTRMAADQALQAHLAQAPEDADQYIVIPEYEVAA